MKIIDVLKDFVIADSAGKMELYLSHPNIEFDESLGYISSDYREPFTITFANKLSDYLKLRLSNIIPIVEKIEEFLSEVGVSPLLKKRNIFRI